MPDLYGLYQDHGMQAVGWVPSILDCTAYLIPFYKLYRFHLIVLTIHTVDLYLMWISFGVG